MTTLFKSKGTLDRAFDAVLSHEIRKLNTHLPKQRQTMSGLLKRTDPTIEAVHGSPILLKTAELMYRDRTSAYLHRPQVVELLPKYHSLFVIGFGVPRELSDYGRNRD